MRSSLNTSEGTIVKEETKMERMLVSGVAADNDVARIALIGVKDEPGVAFKVFNILAKRNINIDIILQSIGRDDSKDIAFTVAESAADEAVEIIESNFSDNYEKIDVSKDVSKVSIVGAGMMTNPGVAAKMFEALSDVGINIRMISSSDINITVVIGEKDTKKAMNAVHDAFFQER